jgi:hypothetical protein
MSLHFNIATEGVRLDHRFIATLGMLSFEVTPEFEYPEAYLGGGTGLPTYIQPTGYTVRVSVSMKGKTYSQTKYFTKSQYDAFKVSISFMRRIGASIELTSKFVGNKLLSIVKVFARVK